MIYGCCCFFLPLDKMLQDSSCIVSEEIDATPQFEATKHQLGVRLPQTTHV